MRTLLLTLCRVYPAQRFCFPPRCRGGGNAPEAAAVENKIPASPGWPVKKEVNSVSEGKLIYSNHFPKSERTVPRIETEKDAVKGPLSLSELLSRRNLIQDIKKNSVCLFRPDKMEECQRFIDLTKQFSQTFQVDAEIKKHDFFISAALDFSCGVYVGEFKRRLSELLNLCDRIALFPSLDEPLQFAFTLDYYTHDCYILGDKAD